MSLVEIRYYKCDICQRKLEKEDLYQFIRNQVYDSILHGEMDIFEDFHMCNECLERIRKEMEKSKNVENNSKV